jgi:EAL domain-containing protein (putative c-di-GMP-specific phosphodiesterase class I)
VLVISGSPSVDTAAKAVEWGALRYLVKPVDHGTLRDAVRTAVSLGRISKLQDEAARLSRTTFLRVRDLAGAEATFNSGIQKLWMAYQPIVSLKDHSVVGQEALLRTTSDEIRSPGAFFELAERTGHVRDLGRSIRAAIATTANHRSPGTDIFVNLHPTDILDPRLYSSDESLLPYANHVVLEITERDAIKDANGVRERLAYLRKCGFRVAVDDLGSGYSGLNYLALLEPDIVKLDMALTRDVHKIPVKQKLVEAMCALSHDLGATIVAEGVECVEEQEVLVNLGCDFLQGYLYAKPGKAFPEVRWPG